MALEDQIFGVSWSDGSADSFSLRPEIEGNAAVKETITLGAGTVTDQQEDIAFTIANLQGVLIAVDGNDLATVLLETNATDATGGDAFTFPIGGGEIYWTSRNPADKPFTAAVTKMYFTKTGADTPRVRIRVLYNP